MDRLQDFARDVEDHTDDAIDPPPSVVSGDERRMHVRAYNYWVSLLGGRAYPSVDDLDLADSRDFGPHSVLLDFTVDPENAVIGWLGERLRAECDLAASVATIADVPARSLLSRLTDHHLQIIANRAPIGFEAEFQNARGNNAMYRGILLPFSSDGQTIDYIYGVINWKEVATLTTARVLTAELDASLATAAARPMVPVWADGPSAATIHAARVEDETEDVPEHSAEDGDQPQAEALVTSLSAARATAAAALTADTRSRGALYQALAQAYDFALLASARGGEYAALLSDARIAVQARAPMTPIVKLIFGRDYDKTRVTEFAAALSFAQRRGLPTGGMKLFLENFPGGLKAIVAAERRERRPEGKPERPDATRDAARALPEQAYLNLPGEDEFVVLVARRIDANRVAIIGVAPDDRPLLDRALRHIVD